LHNVWQKGKMLKDLSFVMRIAGFSQPLHLPIIEQLTRDRLLPYNLVGLTLLQQIKFFVLAVSAIGLVASVV